MNKLSFMPKIKSNPDSLIYSNGVEMNYDGILDVYGAGSVLVNDLEIQTPYSFSSGDILKVGIRSSQNFNTATHAIIRISTDNGLPQTYSFTVITKPQDDLIPIDEMFEMDPFEIKDFGDGDYFYPDSRRNRIHVLDSDLSSLSFIPLLPNIDSRTINSRSIAVCAYHTGKVFRLDYTTKKIRSVIEVGGKPYGAAAVPISRIDFKTNLWVTLSDQNKILIINDENSITGEIPTGNRPMGITVNGDGSIVAFCNNLSNNVGIARYVGDSWQVTTVGVNDRPLEIVVGGSPEDIWVTCRDGVSRISNNNSLFIPLEGIPRGICIANNKVWVALGKANSVAVINIADNSIYGIIPNVGVHTFSVSSEIPEILFTSIIAEEFDSIIVSDGIDITFEGGIVPPFDERFDKVTLLLIAESGFDSGVVVVQPNQLADEQFNKVTLLITAD